MDEKQIIPFVTIKRKGKGISIHSTYTIFYRQIREGGRISCAIPAFDIFYSCASSDVNKIIDKGQRIVKMYIDHFMHHSKNKLKDFVIQIHKLGFIASNDSLTIRKILDYTDSHAKFLSQKPIDSKLDNEKFERVNEEMELAF